jgi:nitrite reductase/ring-hydroxylating ferredoxin subunit
VGEDGWTTIGPIADLAEGRSTRAQVDGTDVLLLHAGDRVFAIGNRCTHQGAPLDRGVARAEGPMPTVTCPAHGSVFSLEDGAVRRGPAARPEPAYDTRIAEGVLEVRSRDGAA